MIWMNSEFYYKLQDFYNENQGGKWKVAGVDNPLNTLLSNYGVSWNLTIELGYLNMTDTIQLLEALWGMVRNYYAEEYCYMVEYDPITETPDALTYEQCQELLRRFTNIINITAPRYVPLLKAFKDASTDPLQKIESTSEGKTRFNDTPQDDDVSDGYYSDDSHATNVTAALTTTTSDPAALYEQLDHLYKNWRSIVRDWIYEFKGLFVEGVNLK